MPFVSITTPRTCPLSGGKNRLLFFPLTFGIRFSNDSFGTLFLRTAILLDGFLFRRQDTSTMKKVMSKATQHPNTIIIKLLFFIAGSPFWFMISRVVYNPSPDNMLMLIYYTRRIVIQPRKFCVADDFFDGGVSLAERAGVLIVASSPTLGQVTPARAPYSFFIEGGVFRERHTEGFTDAR